MLASRPEIKQQYTKLLTHYLDSDDENSLLDANNLGHKMLHDGFPPEELAALHHHSLSEIAKQRPDLKLLDVADKAALPFMELTMMYGIAFREQQAQRTHRERANFDAYIEQTDDYVLFTTESGRLTYMNPAFYRGTGYETKELQNILNFIDTDDEKYPSSSLLTEFKSKHQWKGVLNCLKANGDHCLCELNLFYLQDYRASGAQFVWIFKDVTLQKQLENRLSNAQKLESIGTLASGVAHDFNNILAIIQGFSDLLSDTVTDDLGKSCVAHIHQSVDRGRQLIEQILAFGSSEEATPQLIDPRAAVDEIVSLVEKSNFSNVEIRRDVRLENKFIYINQGQFHQILVNLLVNAMQAIGHSQGLITLTVRALDMNSLDDRFSNQPVDSWVMMSVQDTGKGMSESIRERIFDPFFTTKDVGEGTGLGLAVVYGIVKNYNGFIEVESEEGEGAEFTVYLPILKN